MIGAVEGVDDTDPLRHPPFNAFPRPRLIMNPFGVKGDVDWKIYKKDETVEQMVEWRRARGYKPWDGTSVVEVAHPHLNATFAHLPSKTKDGMWLTLSSEQYIIDNFHIRCIDRYGFDVLENDNELVPRSSSSSLVNVGGHPRDACMVNVTDEFTGEKKSVPAYVPEPSRKRTEDVYYIAHNRFGYLPHLNTLSLRFTKQGFSSRGLADERAFKDMISNLYSTPFMEALVRLEHWQEGAFRLPPKPPDPPASVLYSSTQMNTYYAVLSEGHVEVVEVPATEYTDYTSYEQLLGPLSDNSTDEEVRKAYHRLSRHYHPDRNDEVDPKDEFKMPMINDAKDKVLEWRARPATAPAPRGVALVKKKMKQTNARFYCNNKSYMCAHNRNNKAKYKAGNGGLRPRYEVTETGVDPYMTDTPPRLVCKECNKAGFPDMLMTRNADVPQSDASG